MRISSIVTTALTMGREHQNFIGAKWLSFLLKICPENKKRKLALRLLSLSPHYFYRDLNPEYKNMPFKDFLEAEYERNRDSRRKICKLLLKPYLKSDYRILDYGCGAGFLAKAVSEYAKEVYAVDISGTVIQCAEILNNADNIKYSGVRTLPDFIDDESLDIIYSIAVIQHVTDEVFIQILKNCSEKIKKNGKLLFHVQLEDSKWKTEKEWKSDVSVRGKIKLKYGLNCFSRTSGYFNESLSKFGFKVLSIRNVESICGENFDDICKQDFIEAVKL